MSDTAEYLAEFAGWPGAEISLAIIAGSGLGGVTRLLAEPRVASYSAIPGFAAPTTEGHAGELHVGKIGSGKTLIFTGRTHLYEGVTASQLGVAVRALGEIGVNRVLLCSAAGGIASSLAPGSLMLVTDFINLTFRNPLVGRVVPGDVRFPDMSEPFDREMNAGLRRAAVESGIVLHEGVYAGVAGPSYETVAEIRMLSRLGAAAVGMSTVPEVVIARANGIRIAAICCITNRAAGLQEQPLSHRDVIRVARHAESSLAELIRRFFV